MSHPKKKQTLGIPNKYKPTFVSLQEISNGWKIAPRLLETNRSPPLRYVKNVSFSRLKNPGSCEVLYLQFVFPLMSGIHTVPKGSGPQKQWGK